MTNWIEIRAHLVENFETVFSDFLADKSFDIIKGLDLFNEICIIKEVNDALYQHYVKDTSSLSSRHVLATKIEPFLKRVYLIIDGVPLSGEMASCVKRLFKDSGLVDKAIINDFFDKDFNKNPIKSPDYFKDKLPFGYSLKYVYDLRNAITHKMTVPSKTVSNDIYELMNIYLYAILFYYTDIKRALKEKSDSKVDFTKYLNDVRSKFSTKIGRFVHIDGQEDVSLISSFAIERIDDSDIVKFERKGTVDFLRKNSLPEKRMIIWGDAGTGKSTSLEYLAYLDADDCIQGVSNNVPVYVPLALLTKSDITIVDWIYEKLGVDKEYGERMLRNNRINIFIDGINEVPKDEGYKLRTLRNKEIEALLVDYPSTFVVMSNRPQSINIFPHVPVFRLLKMDDAQIEDFLDKNVFDTSVKQKITDAFYGNDRFKDLVRVPLMLSRFVDIVIHKGEMPSSRGEIIHYFINSLYDRERVEKKDSAFNVFIINRLLARLGYESLEKMETNSGLTESQVISIFLQVKNELGSNIDLQYALTTVTELGILEKTGDLYTFAHQEYQDYFNVEQERMNIGL